MNSCFDSLHEGSSLADEVHLSAPGADNVEQATYIISIVWKKGPGLVCLIVATALRGVEVVVNACVPSPSQQRRRQQLGSELDTRNTRKISNSTANARLEI
jgi:hypothetical protein